MKITRLIASLLIVFVLASLVACGGASTPAPAPQSQPLDPQGNWLFVFTSTVPFKSGSTFSVAGQLFELNPPVVTSNGLGESGNAILCGGSFTFNGQASGTDTINLTGQQVSTNNAPVTMSLTGTIAADQAHMNGNWSVTQAGDCMNTSNGGTWAAQLLAPVTGNWTGTVSNATSNISVTAALTENTDQTTADMGAVTGTITVSGSPCFVTSETFNVQASNASGFSAHTGEGLLIVTDIDAGGVSLQADGSVATDGTSINPAGVTIHGGVCDGQSFTGTLTH